MLSFPTAVTSVINIIFLKLYTSFLSTTKWILIKRSKHPIKYKNPCPKFLLIASRLTCEASGRHSGDPDVSGLHLRPSSSPTRTARPTQCHTPEDLPNFTYFLLDSSTLCFIYRPSKWNLRAIVNESVRLIECEWSHSAATVKCFLANCRKSQNAHPPHSLDLSTHVFYSLKWNTPLKDCRMSTA